MVISLEKIRNRFRNLFEYTTELIYVQDLKGTIVDANERALNLLGYSREDLSKVNFADLLEEEDLHKALKLTKEFAETGAQSEIIEYKLKTRSGETVYVETYGIPIQLEGKVEYVVGIAKDITERIVMQQKVIESEKKFKELVNYIPEGVFEFDSKLNINFVNQAGLKLFGYTQEDFEKGLKVSDVIAPEHLNKAMESAKKLLKGEYDPPADYLMKKKDGTTFYAHVNSNLIYEDGNIVGMRGIVYDITERIKMEQKLRESEKKLQKMNIELEQIVEDRTRELKESEEKYRLISENANDLITIINDKFVHEYINEQAYFNLLGYTKEDIIGKTPLEPLHPDDIEKAAQYLRDGFRNGEGSNEMRIRHKDGHYLWLENKSKLFVDPNGKTKALIISRDITQRKLAEQKIEESLKELKKVNREIEVIMDGVPSLIFLKDTKNNFLRVNQHVVDAQMENLGPGFKKVTKKEMEGKNLFDLVPQEMAQAYWDDDLEVIRTGKPKLNIIEKYESIDGPVALMTSKIPYFDESGKVQGIIGSSIDITDRIRAKEKLEESETKFRHLYENSPNAILLMNINGDIIDCNLNSEILSGFKRDELIGENFAKSSFFPEDYLPLIFEDLKKLLKECVIEPREIQLFNREDTRIWVSYQGSLVRVGNEDIIQVIIQDISERKKSEIKLKEQAKKLGILNTIMVAGNTAEDLSTLLEEILGFALELVNFDAGGIYLVDETNNIAEIACHRGLPLDYLEFVKKVRVDEPPYSIVLKDKQPIIAEDFSVISPELSKMGNVKSLAAFPLTTKGKVIGALNIASKTRHIFSNEEIDILKGIGSETGSLISKFQTETELRKSEEQYRNIIENTYDAIIIMGYDGKVKFVSPQMSILLGRKIDTNSKTFKYIHPDDVGELRSLYETIIKQKSSIDIEKEFRMLHSNGRYIWVSAAGKNYIDDEGNKVGVITTIRDITEQKKAELKLKESEERYRNLVTNISDAIAETDINGNILYITPQASEMFGYTTEELINHKISDFVPPEDFSKIAEVIKRAIQTGEQMSVEIQIQHKNGNYIPIYARGSGFETKGETRLVGVLSDITEQKKAESLIKDELKKLRELDQLKTDLILRASHEFKTPLNSIWGASQMLLNYYKDALTDKLSNLVEIINRGGARLKRLVDDLLDVTRIESGIFELHLTKEDLTEIIAESIDNMNYLLLERDITLNIDAHNEIELNVDKIRIEQLISSLLSNAIKNTPPKGKISIKLDDYDDFVEISVIDSGIGFTEEEKSKIFQKFGKIERYGQGLDVITEGSGLGLYLSKEIVESHKGTIRLESDGRNKGSKFIVKIPKKS